MRLHVDQRHERVLELVRERGSLRVAELAEELGMSAVTLRRDVEALAAQGLVERLHGAVVWPTGQSRPAPAAAPPPKGWWWAWWCRPPSTTTPTWCAAPGRPSRPRAPG